MKKIWFLSLLVGSIVLSGCGIFPQEEKMLSGEVMSGEVLSGEVVQEEEALTGETLMSQFPKCTPIQVRPFAEWEPIDIDKVAVNCKYEQGDIYFSSTDGLGGRCGMISIFNEGIFDWDDDDQVKWPVCQSKENGISLWEPIGEYKVLAEFMKRHWLPEKKLIESAGILCQQRWEPREEFFCGQTKLCKSLKNLAEYWEAWENYFIFGTRPYAEDSYRNYLVINDKLYSKGEGSILENSQWYITQEWDRRVSQIIPEKIVLRRLTQGSFVEPYKSNPDLLSTLWEKDDGKTVIGSYKVKTCEIPL